MIVTENINGSPKEDILTKFGRHSDKDYFYIFENNEEKEEFYSNLEIINNTTETEINGETSE